MKDTATALLPLPAKAYSGIAKETTGSKSFRTNDEEGKLENICSYQRFRRTIA